MQVDVKLTGMDECMNRLKTLSQEMAAKTLLSATYTAMQPMEKRAEQILVSKGAIRTGTLKKSISRKKIVRAKDQTVTIMVGINKSIKGSDPKGRRVWPVKYAHLVESKKPFMREAYNQTSQEVLNKYIRVLERKLNKAGA